MKLIIILFLMLMDVANCQTALGIKYDAVKLAKLKHDLSVGGKDLAPLDGNIAPLAYCIVDVDRKLFKNIDSLFREDQDFNNGLNDSRYQAFSLIFYREGKVVLTVTPNVLGGDIYATDQNEINDSRSFSKQQMKDFLDICFWSLNLDRIKNKSIKRR